MPLWCGWQPFELRENDYVFGLLKFGGNAQSETPPPEWIPTVMTFKDSPGWRREIIRDTLRLIRSGLLDFAELRFSCRHCQGPMAASHIVPLGLPGQKHGLSAGEAAFIYTLLS